VGIDIFMVVTGCKKEEYSRERKIALESGNNNLNFK
jgi:hypothetical protein